MQPPPVFSVQTRVTNWLTALLPAHALIVTSSYPKASPIKAVLSRLHYIRCDAARLLLVHSESGCILDERHRIEPGRREQSHSVFPPPFGDKQHGLPRRSIPKHRCHLGESIRRGLHIDAVLVQQTRSGHLFKTVVHVLAAPAAQTACMMPRRHPWHTLPGLKLRDSVPQ